MPGDAAARLAYLDETLPLLWPAGAGADRVVLPGPRAPRLLVPRRPARAGAGALVRYTAQQGPRERAAGLAVAAAARAGLARVRPAVAPRGGSGEPVDALLARVLGEPVTSALALSPRRANRKPVLQVFDRRGRTLAFAKVGVSPLARDLVDAEAAALDRLARAGLDGTPLLVPRVLHHGAWRDTRVLVTSALPLGRRVADGAPLLRDAMRAVAGTGPADGGDAYLAGLRGRLPATGPWAQLLTDLAAAGAPVTGAWHGDWTAWNCARRGARLAVWDWERYTAPAPLGFDALHFRLNEAVGKHRTGFAAAAPQLVADAPRLLAPWGVAAGPARVTAGLYLLDVALRYVADGAGGSPEAVERWAVAAVRAAARPETRGATST